MLSQFKSFMNCYTCYEQYYLFIKSYYLYPYSHSSSDEVQYYIGPNITAKSDFMFLCNNSISSDIITPYDCYENSASNNLQFCDQNPYGMISELCAFNAVNQFIICI